VPFLRNHGLLVLLGFVPVSIALERLAPDRHIAIFCTSVLAILPLAANMGRATEALAEHLGGGIGGFLNATFGNAAELIIGALALRAGPDRSGQSVADRIDRRQRAAVRHLLRQPGVHAENASRAVWTGYRGSRSRVGGSQGRRVGGSQGHRVEGCVASGADAVRRHDRRGRDERTRRGNGIEAARSLGMSELFVGVVVIALVGNAAEHYSAVTMASNDKMDAAIAIAIGSSTQIALFVARALVFLSYLIAPAPMDLLFTTFEIVAIALAVLSIAFIAHDGRDALDGRRAASRRLHHSCAGVLFPA
jgi:Ca2+:H+ antiporter